MNAARCVMAFEALNESLLEIRGEPLCLWLRKLSNPLEGLGENASQGELFRRSSTSLRTTASSWSKAGLCGSSRPDSEFSVIWSIRPVDALVLLLDLVFVFF
mmetsp:Transcript_94378/g.249535  ORF Transcript_94378/g.249535 Transcript_94378/m.249535 type:complete len:102 (-) Transcript_94378:486-791(-)